ncbi:acyl-CoA thioesterase [bacterium]|nr:acyl-CoA thioesterase [bacterium]
MENIEETHTLALQKMIFGAHLNAANCLFGGNLLSWIDEASAMFAMDIMQTRKILTKKISEVIFINPALLGDMIQFWCNVTREGNSSLTMELVVRTKNVDTRQQRDILTCEIVYVAVDDLGKPFPWRHNRP